MFNQVMGEDLIDEYFDRNPLTCMSVGSSYSSHRTTYSYPQYPFEYEETVRGEYLLAQERIELQKKIDRLKKELLDIEQKKRKRVCK